MKRFSLKKITRGFVLLEVILSIMILGIAIAALLRSFTISLASARRAQITTTATLLAQHILEEYEVVPPQEDHMEGSFAPSDEDYYYDEVEEARKESRRLKHYYWMVDVEIIDVDYPDHTFEGDLEDFERLIKLSVTIIYDDGQMKRFIPVRLETYLTEIEKFTYTSKRENQLF